MLAANRLLVCWLVFSILSPAAVFPLVVNGQDQQPTSGRPWKLDEVLGRLHWYPHDPYLQFVALQLARREERLPEVASRVEQLTRVPGFFGRNERVEQVDLFNIFSGALAIQESLQLDAMRGNAGAQRGTLRPAANQLANVNVRELTGPTIKSHPWVKMLAGKRPEISPLARCVLADSYFIEFRSVSKLLEAMEAGDLWGQHLLSQLAEFPGPDGRDVPESWLWRSRRSVAD